MRLFRFWLSRHLIHAGLYMMPPGVAQDELYSILLAWGDHVREMVAESRLRAADIKDS
jgi:hypothetical protein